MKNPLQQAVSPLHALLRAVRRPSARKRLAALQRDVGRLLRIDPVFVARDAHAFHAGASRVQPAPWLAGYEQKLEAQGGRIHLQRFCLCCNETTPMLVDMESSWQGRDGARVLNWRERLICDQCGMNNRQRLVAKLVQQAAAEHERARIYLTEQVTPIFQWVRRLPATDVHGSEYLGDQHRGGDVMDGVRHEDAMNLSYPDASFDLIVSNDVLEHIPDPAKALRECSRVLRPGGVVLATFPFQTGSEATVVRATLGAGGLKHLLPAQFHGNPVSAEGSLVFQDFGWDLLATMRQAGFSDAACEVYMNDAFGHLGVPLLVFRLRK
ncbi:methyltransferase domain-containing protein [Ramlibacter sp. PS3R-8]|uniref:class I SAM-dependent methyltransferase n=1 Tax=Ramlibacter sp. PS3R-8 TaxID=3133437 RepID=UPI0030AE56E5